MYIDPQWSTVLGIGMRWAKDLLTSKKGMRLEVEELSKKVDQLVYGNAELALRHGEILAALVSELQGQRIAVLNQGTLTFISAGPGSSMQHLAVTPTAPPLALPPSSASSVQEPAHESFFVGVDEAIASARLARPSER